MWLTRPQSLKLPIFTRLNLRNGVVMRRVAKKSYLVTRERARVRDRQMAPFSYLSDQPQDHPKEQKWKIRLSADARVPRDSRTTRILALKVFIEAKRKC